jgi:RNA polymerase subunit RPABC4/transcription elongation factor Spt4
MPISIGAVLVGVAILVLVIPLVARPFKEPRAASAPSEGDRPPPLESVLTSLRDLDFDHQTGKVSQEDYASTRAELLAQAAQAMESGGGASLEDRLEEKVRRLRQELERVPPSACAGCGERLAPGDRYCPSCGRAQFRACPSCGSAVRPGDGYCTACGRRLQAEPALSP